MRSFVGFGFGPIQSGLFVYEAFRSGKFSRFVVAEVDQKLVDMVRAGSGEYHLNIAHPDRIEQQTIRGLEIYNPAVPADRAKLVAAVAEADEISTALPSVDFYASGSDGSVLSILVEGLHKAPGKQRIIYTAENNNHAAEVLSDLLRSHLEPGDLANLQTLNTVIGKMSGVITEPASIKALAIAPLTPSSDRAVLVEAFNRILISRITLKGFERGIEAFVEKPDLLPFEEAKLYGHNAIHALIGYVAHKKGMALMSDVAKHPEILNIARLAFTHECGTALVRKYAALNDPFFTTEGFNAYAEDLLARMVNPNLNDQISRVIRDTQRKLGFHDRIFGAMHLVLRNGIRPINLARGAAAAVEYFMHQRPASRENIERVLAPIWKDRIRDRRGSEMIDLVWHVLSN